jgi:hypothetical protein
MVWIFMSIDFEGNYKTAQILMATKNRPTTRRLMHVLHLIYLFTLRTFPFLIRGLRQALFPNLTPDEAADC